MSKKLLGILVAVAVVVIAILAISSGGSSDHSSEWTSAQTAQLEGEMESIVPEFTSEGIQCIVKGTESAFSPSDALSHEGYSGSQHETQEGIVKQCSEDSSNVQGILSQACQEEGVLGPVCQEEVANQATEELGLEAEIEEGSSTETYPEGYETENEGLNELNEELQEETE
jgi:hypothetical protein